MNPVNFNEHRYKSFPNKKEVVQEVHSKTVVLILNFSISEFSVTNVTFLEGFSPGTRK